MEKPYRNRKILIFLMIFLLVVLFPNGVESIQKDYNNPKQVIIGGELLQLDIKTSKLMVYCKNDDNPKLKNYDLIESVEGEIVKKIYNKNILKNIKKEDILKVNLNMKKDDKVLVTIKRNGKLEKVYLSKEELHHGYFTDQIPFTASLTYIDPYNKSFGAVAHNMNVNNNKELLCENGEVFFCNLSQVQKSTKNNIGYMQGNIVSKRHGKISNINNFGVRGFVNCNEVLTNREIYEVGEKDSVKNGKAQLIIKDNINCNKQIYDIDIIKINKQNKPQVHSFEFKVIDENLIENYGGIVQGMSGCPIVQNGKLIGALSHVISSDTTNGVGVFIEWMMED